MRYIRTRRLLFLVLVNLVVILACLPSPLELSTPTPPGPLKLPTPTPLPPTPTPTPLPATKSGTIVRDMTRRHETLSTIEIDQLLAGFLPSNNLVPAQYAVDTYRVWFRTRDENGLVIAIQADVRFPRVEETGTFPVFVYGSGTTGIANRCGTLNEQFAGRNWGDYRSHMTSYAAQGYITILANWQGFDHQDATHPYFVAELEGRVMLDAARAVYDFFEDPPANDILARPHTAVFVGGYSQGGHGAFAAGRMASEYAPELEIIGMIGHAMAPDVEGLMYDSPRYGPYIVYAYRAFYGEEIVDPADVFLPHWLPTFGDDCTSKCIDEVFDYYPNTPARLFTAEFRDALYDDRLAEEYPAFKQKLDLNDSGDKEYPAVPSIILHGDADPIVKLRTINRFVAYMCGEGNNVTYNIYGGVNHFQTRQYSFFDTLTWMQNILTGDAPVSNCTELIARAGVSTEYATDAISLN